MTSDAVAAATKSETEQSAETSRDSLVLSAGRVEAELWLPRPLDEVFAFFADAANLERITPPWLRFRILTPTPIRMRVGTLIDYGLTVHRIPVRWRSEITEWDPPHAFTDEQRRGPYRTWVHRHLFRAERGGTRVVDFVDYRVWGGRVFDRLFVRRDVERIFRYRHGRLDALGG